MIDRRYVLAGSLALFPWSEGRAVAGPIDERGFQNLGDIEQWVSIRGSDARNPVLLIIHGGPGEAQSALSHIYTAGWERHFTVVQWDQRGSGRTFGRNRNSTTELTTERLLQDAVELSARLNATFGRRIVVVGHSWGSYLGVRLVKVRPDLFSGFIGTGQLSSWRRLVDDELAYTLARARADSNATAIIALEAMNAKAIRMEDGSYFGLRRWLNPYLASADITWTSGMSGQVRSSPGMTAKDAADWEEGRLFSVGKLGAAVAAIDLPALGERFEVPYILIHGREDYVAFATAALEYYDRVQAPAKNAHVIDGGGHYAMMTHTSEFLTALERNSEIFG